MLWREGSDAAGGGAPEATGRVAGAAWLVADLTLEVAVQGG